MTALFAATHGAVLELLRLPVELGRVEVGAVLAVAAAAVLALRVDGVAAAAGGVDGAGALGRARAGLAPVDDGHGGVVVGRHLQLIEAEGRMIREAAVGKGFLS